VASESRTTTDHEEIRLWVEEHDGAPDWDEWFAKFDAAGLTFLYQEHKAGGSDSTFLKLIRN
jgi:hypothetical protein